MTDWAEFDVNVDNGRLHGYRMGSGRPVVLAHGATDNGRCWTRVAAALADRYELIAYDARGHGRSTDVVEGWQPGADLVAVVEALGLEHPAAMGHSMGATAVGAALGVRPDLFAAAVLEDPGWGLPSVPAESAGTGERVRSLTGWVATLQTKSLEQVIAEGRKQSPTWHDDDLPAWAESKLQFHPGTGGLGAALRVDWREQVRAFGCPVLLVCGSPDQAIVTPEIASEAAGLNRRVDVVRLEAGHNIRREAFDGFLAAVRSFFAQHLK
jgi:pimeloyl-ACP methyl ester carboxylesterase